MKYLVFLFALATSPCCSAAPPLLRSYVIADRATIIAADPVSSFQVLDPTIPLARMNTDGNGSLLDTTASVTSPKDRTRLSFPNTVNRGEGYPYPKVLLRHAFSPHGLFTVGMVDASWGPGYRMGLVGATIPNLERANAALVGPDGKVTVQSWGFFRDNSSALVISYPVLTARDFMGNGDPNNDRNRTCYFDIHVTNRADSEFYSAEADGSIKCMAQSILPSKMRLPSGDGKPPELRFSVPGDIRGPFAVVPHGKARYIVTEAGAVQRMVGVDGKACDKLTTVFDKEKVLAVVHDADEEKRYAFTATHFFEVAEPFVLKTHAVKKIDTTNGRTGLESAFHCARAVRGLPPMAFPEPKANAPAEKK